MRSPKNLLPFKSNDHPPYWKTDKNFFEVNENYAIIWLIAITELVIVVLFISAISFARNVYLIDHQQELIDQQKELMQIIENFNAQKYALQNNAVYQQQEPESVMDSITKTHSISSFSSVKRGENDENFIVNDTFIMPSNAIRINKNTYYLGETYMNSDIQQKRSISEFEEEPVKLQILAHIHWVDDSTENSESNKVESNVENYATTCYAFNAIGSIWKHQEDYIIRSSNNQGLSDSFIASTFANSISKWQSNLPHHQIFGSRSSASSDGVGSNEPDGRNELIFGSVSMSGVIAVTITYGTFQGPVDKREIVEWDMIVNQNDYRFGDALSNSRLMDLESIFTHESGHICGLADVYASACSDATMYGYSSEGQTNKRSLASADTTGVRILYGESTGSSPSSNDPKTNNPANSNDDMNDSQRLSNKMSLIVPVLLISSVL